MLRTTETAAGKSTKRGNSEEKQTVGNTDLMDTQL